MNKRIAVILTIIVICVAGSISFMLFYNGVTQNQNVTSENSASIQQTSTVNQNTSDNSMANSNQNTTSVITENITNTNDAAAANSNASEEQIETEPQYNGDRATSDDQALSEAKRLYNQDADFKLARDLVSRLYEYTNQSLASDWLSGVMVYVDQNAMSSHPNDKNGDNDKYALDNVLATRTNSAWYNQMARYEGISSHVESIVNGNVFATYNNGTIYPVVRLYITYTANATMLDTSNNTWKSMNRFYDQVLVWLTPDQSHVFMVTTTKSTIVDYDLNHVLTERHILNEEEQEQKALQLSQTMGL